MMTWIVCLLALFVYAAYGVAMKNYIDLFGVSVVSVIGIIFFTPENSIIFQVLLFIAMISAFFGLASFFRPVLD